MKHLLLMLALVCVVGCGGNNVARSQNESAGRNTSSHAAADTRHDHRYQPPVEIREWYRNPGRKYQEEGSCVQCAIGKIAIRNNCMPLATLLWETKYGPAIHHASNPARVAAYCEKRGVPVYIVTGAPAYQYAVWAAKTGRGAALSFGKQHFQAMMGYDAKRRMWLICDNNSAFIDDQWTPLEIETYTDAEFRDMLEAGGSWIVVIDCPAPAPPVS